MNLVDFLFSANGGKILLGLIGILIIIGFLWQSQCNFVNQTKVAQQYAGELTIQKQKALDDKIVSLKKKLENVPQTPPKTQNFITNLFTKKPKGVPESLEKSKDRLNGIGDKCNKLSKESKK